jgi:hypothetical protein
VPETTTPPEHFGTKENLVSARQPGIAKRRVVDAVEALISVPETTTPPEHFGTKENLVSTRQPGIAKRRVVDAKLAA